MIKDIGIVLLPNPECKNYSLNLTSLIDEKLPEYKRLVNNPHVTLLHIANQDEVDQALLGEAFDRFIVKYSDLDIKLPIEGIWATGGSRVSGYKWLDLSFQTFEVLNQLRESVLTRFCSSHNGILTRMYDDISNYTRDQLNQIGRCGVVTHPYKPHITLWYIDLPNEDKTDKLEDIANSFKNEEISIKCHAQSIALVELGRNGNAIDIIRQYSLMDEIIEEL